jgi:4-hydroxymandelate oxidase
MKADPINLADLEALAAERVEPTAWDYYRSGAHDERTLRDNVEAWARYTLRYRVLCDVSTRSTKTTVLGYEVAAPILVAPTAFHRLAHPEGERATVRGAGAFGTIFVLSSLSNTAMEDVVADATGPVFFQLYVYKDRGATRALVERAEAAGCAAIVLTVDAPLLGTRERDVRNGFHLPDGLAVENVGALGRGDVDDRGIGESGLAAYVQEQLDPSLTFDDVAWLASITSLPLVVKGLVRGDDAVRSIEHGARAVVVSNHGGRQLDGAIASADALPAVVDAIGDRAEVLVDGGIRRGGHVLTALALGARAVLIGRPILWGLAWDGANGVEQTLRILGDELDLTMALAGCPTISDIKGDLLAR